ncbi:MAG: class I SAM-dependent methyltransferase [Helicobacteraceae bacterium]|jgi:predicted O-methyltransferase YrrM|nr:class I SAM-dependent methyltransferase [Helicobacteraceae bacterium]
MKSLSVSADSLEMITPSDKEINLLSNLDPAYVAVLEMTKSEREFVTALICRYKPRKLLELGVSAGGSSVLMMSAANKTNEGEEYPARLYAIDYAEKYYRNIKLSVGYIVDQYPELKPHYHIYSGGMAYRFLDLIGEDIDFCLIDTAHVNPGEILDFLMVLPYLKENAVVVLHDVGMHTSMSSKSFARRDLNHTTALLFSAICGKVLLPAFFSKTENNEMYFANVGAIVIDKTTREHLFGAFNLLTIRWSYKPSSREESEICEFFQRHYDQLFADFTARIFAYHNHYFTEARRRTPLVRKILRKALPLWAKTILARIYDRLLQ